MLEPLWREWRRRDVSPRRLKEATTALQRLRGLTDVAGRRDSDICLWECLAAGPPGGTLTAAAPASLSPGFGEMAITLIGGYYLLRREI